MKKEKNVIFLMFPAIGHYNASFHMARTLIQHQYRVIYICPERYEAYVQTQGFEVYKVDGLGLPFGLGFEESQHKLNGSKTVYLDSLIDRLSDKMYIVRQKHLQEALKKLTPSTIFIDSYSSTDGIILFPYRESIKLIFLQTMLSVCQKPFHPPLCTDLIPTVNNQHRVEQKWNRLFFQKRWKRIKNKIKYVGADDHSRIQQKLKAYDFPEDYVDTKTSLKFSMKGFPELLVGPEELEFFPEEKSLHQEYLGSMLDIHRIEHYPKGFEQLLIELEYKKKLYKQKVIYVSLGTVALNNKKLVNKVVKFFKKLVGIANRNPDYFFVLSTDDFIQRELDLPENVIAFYQVPQMKLLNHCDLFITHGGLNSIKESLYTNTPMLVCPLLYHLKIDNPGNAARIQFHQLGLMGSIEYDKEFLLESKINLLLTDPRFRVNIASFNKVCKQKYTSTRFLEIFRRLTEPTSVKVSC